MKITTVSGPWQQHGDACYQLRTPGGRLVCYVWWHARGWPRCQKCETSVCDHVRAVRAWRKEQRAPRPHCEDGVLHLEGVRG